MTSIKAFFLEIRALPIFEKRQGRPPPPPLPHLVTRLQDAK